MHNKITDIQYFNYPTHAVSFEIQDAPAHSKCFCTRLAKKQVPVTYRKVESSIFMLVCFIFQLKTTDNDKF